jgi:hypothetical protein
MPGGLGVLPRGSVSAVTGDSLRFFAYWREKQDRTDYDLSALLLDEHYQSAGHLSWTRLTSAGGVHSGDITQSANGATEFIDLQLPMVAARFIVPQLDIYSGEGFDEVAESFFGFMTRDAMQAGQPFEPRTVRMKSDLRGKGRVALPLAFMRGDDGKWRAKWLHLYLRGQPSMNVVEGNRVTTALLVRSVVGRDYLRVGYLAQMMAAAAKSYTLLGRDDPPCGPVTFIGLEQPDGLAPGSTVIQPGNLADLIPA